MRSETSLPGEFAELQGIVNYVVKRGAGEYSSSCPSCGGSAHQDGSFPDRFVLFIASRATGNPMGWCRSCGYLWHPGKLKGETWKPTPQQLAEWQRERMEREQIRLTEAQHAIGLLQAERAWKRYHANLATAPDYATRELERRLITGWYADYWDIGYCEQKWACTNGVNFASDTLTIPIRPRPGEPVGIKHRLLKPINPGDKYRPEFKGLPNALFVADHERELTGACLVVEGEFKAMTTWRLLDDPGRHVVGLPGKSPDTELLKPLENCEPVIICLDPDAYQRAAVHKPGDKTAVQRIAEAVGDKARVIHLAGKIDDMLLAGQLTKQGLTRLMNAARRAV